MRKHGFTLIELMIVIAIIAILAAILVPNFLKAKAQSQFRACVQNMQGIITSIEMYSVDYGECPPGDGTFDCPPLVPNYLKSWPKCPASGSSYYYCRYTGYPPRGGKHGFFLSDYKSPSAHASLGISPYCPAYRNQEGWYMNGYTTP